MKFIEHWLSKEKNRDDTASQFRQELRGEVVTLREEIRRAEKDLDEWKDKYYQLLEDNLNLLAQNPPGIRERLEAKEKEQYKENGG